MDPATLRIVLQLGLSLGRSRMVRTTIGCLLALALAAGSVTVLGSWTLASQMSGSLRVQQQVGNGVGSCTEAATNVVTGPASTEGMSASQIGFARTIWQAAQDAGMGDPAAIIGIATALQESTLHNLTWGDRDSVGLFQQRTPWGSLADRMDPRTSAGMFYRGGQGGQPGLDDIPGWRDMEVARAAQAVQVSAFPSAYAKHEPTAVGLVALFRLDAPVSSAVAAAISSTRCEPTDAAPPSSGGGPVPASFDQQGNPRTVEQAIAWMQHNAPTGAPGERVLNGCERYMNLSFDIGGGYPTAIGHWNASGPKRIGADDTPPRGALVFWRTDNPAGHVGLSLGGGIVASTDYNPATHSYQAGVLGIGPITDIDAWGPRLGWRAPNFQVGSGR